LARGDAGGVCRADERRGCAAFKEVAGDREAPQRPVRELWVIATRDDEEESSSLTEALRALAGKWPPTKKFQESDVARLLNDRGRAFSLLGVELAAA
jgi:hypothetical protein